MMPDTKTIEIFISADQTSYHWSRDDEHIVSLGDHEVDLLRTKVSMMNDSDIQNRESSLGKPMGIPVPISRERAAIIKERLVDILRTDPYFAFTDHSIDRILEDSLLDANDPNKRGWTSRDEVKRTVLSVRRVEGVRLNVNHNHPDNTERIKHLHSQMALVISGKKDGEANGRVVLVILSENSISVITIL